MTFRELLLRAKAGEEEAMETLIAIYKPLLVRGSIVRGVFDEDLFQEQCITLLKCIDLFDRLE